MQTPTVGVASTEISARFAQTMRPPIRARQVLTTVAACANPKVDAIPARSIRPSEKEIAARITSDWSTPPARIATSTPAKLTTLSGFWWSTRCMNSTATTLLATVKLARLKATFNGDWRRWIDNAKAVPATIESTTTSGGAKKNPTTMGSSLREKEEGSRGKRRVQ